MAKNNLNLKSIYGQKGFLLIFLLIIAISCSYGLLYPILIRSNFNSDENKISVSRQVINTIQWVNNTNFNSTDNWDIMPVNQGSGSDVEGEINLTQEQANLKILGDEGEFSNISGTPHPGEWNKTQNGNLVFPDNSGGDQYGFWADHTWTDPNDPNQSVSVHWERLIELPVDMSDYNITSISLENLFNATVTTENTIDEAYKGGVDVPGDTVDTPASWFEREFDYVRFYVLITDVNRTNSYEIGFNQTSQLGRDGTSGTIENGDMYVIPEESMRSFLTTILDNDPNHNSFIFTLGMRVYCADNGQGDIDIWDELRFLNCNFSFNYKKIIDRSSSISLRNSGPAINGTNVKINSANLSFYYKINNTWNGVDSPNSELRILINNKEHNERIKLSEIPASFSKNKADGFNIGNIINPYIQLNLSIQIFLGDTFELNESIMISFDNVTLSIQYTEIFSEISAEPWYTSYLLYGGIIFAAIIGGSFLSYYFVFKYPKTVRRVRKFRKSLRKNNIPSTNVRDEEELFKSSYKKQLQGNSNIRKIQPGKPKIGKSFKIIIILILVFNFLLAPLILNLTNQSVNQERILTAHTNNDKIGLSGEVLFTRNWLINSRFSTTQSWSVIFGTDGDPSDVSGNIEQDQGIYLINGSERTFIAAEGIPTSSNWNAANNTNFPDNPDVYEINEFGCFANHTWVERSDQTPSIHWERMIIMPDDMSDKIITSVSMKTKVNATVTTNSGEQLFGVDTISDNPNNYATGDYVRFYVLFSDINNEVVFEVAYNQTVELGRDSPAKPNMMDTFLNNIPEEKIIEYLTNIFKRNSTSFKATLGIRIWCEDNYPNDRDRWDELWIKEFNLNITYSQKIDKFTSISFFQEGDAISGENVRIIDGNLRFKYKINDTWPELASPSSEIRVLINGNPHTETIRLSSATSEFQPNNPDGYDVTDLLLKDININLSIQVYLADTFELNRAIKISIDDVYLEISYIDVIVDITTEPWFNTALFIGIMAIAAVLGIYFWAYYRYLRFPLPIRKIRKYRSSLTSDQPPKGVLTPSREIAFNRKYSTTMGSSSKLLEGKSTESSLKIDILKDELK